MTAPTVHLLGDLLTETLAADEPVYDLEAPPQTWYRPVGVLLVNDRVWHHWMMPGESYRVEHDGAGWRVTCQSWPAGHTYHLADVDGRLTGVLWLADGPLTLQPDRVYLLREAARHQWAAHETTG